MLELHRTTVQTAPPALWYQSLGPSERRRLAGALGDADRSRLSEQRGTKGAGLWGGLGGRPSADWRPSAFAFCALEFRAQLSESWLVNVESVHGSVQREQTW